MINEDVAVLTSGARSIGEEVGYKYAEIEKRHKYRFLFDPLRLLENQDFITSYAMGENPFPKSVEIDPSNACNHNCSFCIYHSMHSKERSETMQRSRLLETIDELGELGVKSILFVGGGEPMAHPDTTAAIERAHSYGISAGLVTNGSLVKPKFQAKLKKHAAYVRFSLDAASPELHLKLHQKDDHPRIIDNLRNLAAQDGPCTVGTGFFINEDNVHEVQACAELVKSTGANYIQLKSYSGVPMSTELQNEALKQVERVLDLQDDDFDVHVMDRIFANETHQVRGYTKCHWQAFKPIINADGNVYLCAQKRTNNNGVIGNIYEKSLKEIWESDERRKVVEELNLYSCPYCVHHQQNQMIEFFSSFVSKHKGFF
ncbi:MAG: radical SAM protein [Rhodobacter sp.]|nr:radical SAM protein [Rhodobacter sp.]